MQTVHAYSPKPAHAIHPKPIFAEPVPVTGICSADPEVCKRFLIDTATLGERALGTFPEIVLTSENRPIMEIANQLEKLPNVTITDHPKKPFKNTYFWDC